jgi:site-specific DNA-methyltransferase (adenine-specific)
MKFMAGCKDGEFDLIFIDPPYFEIKGEFDFRLSFSEWIEMHAILAEKCRRILKDNGTVILWGHAKNIAYQQIEFDKYFYLLNSCVWEKINAQTKKNSIDQQRAFIPITERFLLYDKGEDKTGSTMIFSSPDLFQSIKKYMREEKKKIKIAKGFKTEKEFNEYINTITQTSSVASRHYFSDSQYVFPTAEMYSRLQQSGFFKRPYESQRHEYESLRHEYESLRHEYESLRRYFRLTEEFKYDVIRWSQEAEKTKHLKHPTCKPPGLVRRLLTTCCRPGSKIFEPFAGTETTRTACYDMGFDYVGCELDSDYWQAQEKRYQDYIEQQSLFSQDEIQELTYYDGELI